MNGKIIVGTFLLMAFLSFNLSANNSENEHEPALLLYKKLEKLKKEIIGMQEDIEKKEYKIKEKNAALKNYRNVKKRNAVLIEKLKDENAALKKQCKK